jgi:hypothetical protein
MVLDYVTTFSIIAIVVFLSLKTRSLNIAIAVPLLGILSTGIIIESLNFFGYRWNSNSISLLLIIVISVGAVTAVRETEPPADRVWARQFLAVGIPVIGILILITVSRLLAKHQLDGLLTNILYINSEDNAKWTNVTSLIVQGKSLVISDIGGVVTTYLVVCARFIKVLFPIFGLNNSEISVSILTVVCGQLFLMILAPLSLLPLTKLLSPSRYAWKALPGFWLSSLIIAGGSTAFQSLGQLASQFVLFLAVYSVCILMTSGANQKSGALRLFIGLLCVVATASAWLPLHLLTAVIPVIAVGVALFPTTKSYDKKVLNFSSKVILALILAAPPIAIASFQYLTFSKANFQNLLLAGGATNTVNPILNILPICLFILIIIRRQTPKTNSAEWMSDLRNYENIAVILLVAMFTIAVIYVDYIRTGSAHYGSLKVQYMCALILIVTMIPIAVAKITTSELPIPGFILAGTCSMLLLFSLSGDVTFTALTTKFRAQQCPEIAIWTKEVNWQAYITDMTLSEKKIVDMPIACGEIVVGKRYWNVSYGTYLCTRHLVALAGLEKAGGPLVEWQLRANWISSINYLRMMPDEVKNRNVLILSAEGKVVGEARVDSYFNNDGFQRG